MSIDHLSAVVAAAQNRSSELEGNLADAQRLLADLTAKRTDAIERAQAALQAVRRGELTEAVAGLRHSLALQDAADLDSLIAQGQSALGTLINDVAAAHDSTQRAQNALAVEERRLIADGIKARLVAAEANFLRICTEAYHAHKVAGGSSGSICAIGWWPSNDLIAMATQGIVPRY
ncbi:hypothetical protein KDX16_24910 [Burkholderia vietnamiensis]|uniref:hypothetical protein n=1 Tax=Burkholderia vietnamiensis TaxID=60552 RepID=UPI001BA4043E|nr:hypothetical protein [Burkholderia vietnamiensis]MBR7919039.1 hypothetical protein [Burkholderia vietnamiensis]